MERFIEEDARETLEGLCEDQFRSIVAAEIAKRCERPTTNGDEASAIWGEVLRRGSGLFDRQAREVELLKGLERADLCRFYDERLAAGGEATARLAVHVDSKGSSPGSHGHPRLGPRADVGAVAAFKAGARFT